MSSFNPNLSKINTDHLDLGHDDFSFKPAAPPPQAQTEKVTTPAEQHGYPAVNDGNKYQCQDQAPKLSSSNTNKIVRGVTAFCTLGLSEGIRKGISLVISKNPEGKQGRIDALNNFKKENFQDFNKIADRVEVTTKDGAKLDGMILKHSGGSNQSSEIDPNQKWVVRINGWGERYEYNLGESQKIADQSKANILTFNYRGTGESTGNISKANDLVNDSISMVEFLKSKGVPEENITILGHSLGGGVGALTAAQYDKVSHINSRSFSKLSTVVKNHVENTVAKHAFLRRGAATAGNIAAGVVKSLGFELNAEKSIDKIQNRTLVVYDSNDPMISHEASFFQAVQNQPQESQGVLQGRASHIQSHTIHNPVKLDFSPIKENNLNEARKLFSDNLNEFNNKINPKGSLRFDKAAFDKDPDGYKIQICQKMIDVANERGQLDKVRSLIQQTNDFNLVRSNAHTESLLSYPQAEAIFDFINSSAPQKIQHHNNFIINA